MVKENRFSFERFAVPHRVGKFEDVRELERQAVIVGLPSVDEIALEELDKASTPGEIDAIRGEGASLIGKI